MTTNFLYAQAPNRKGNISKDTAKNSGGVTNVTGKLGSVAIAKGNQGAPKASGNPLKAGCAPKVSIPKDTSYQKNDGYRNSSFLK